MKQPELGKKIAELRKSKGLTQEELVEQCNLNVRTIQRIEAGEVTPRSYTLKIIFSALDYDIFTKPNESRGPIKLLAKHVSQTIQDYFRDISDIFNFKTNTMKKLSFITIVILFIALGIFNFSSFIQAQSYEKVKEEIEKCNENFIQWFNNGEVDLLLTLYTEDACLIPNVCNKDNFTSHFVEEINKGYKMQRIEIENLTVSGKIAVEKGKWKVVLPGGSTLHGEYLVEWHYVDKKWLMYNDIAAIKTN